MSLVSLVPAMDNHRLGSSILGPCFRCDNERSPDALSTAVAGNGEDEKLGVQAISLVVPSDSCSKHANNYSTALGHEGDVRRVGHDPGKPFEHLQAGARITELRYQVSNDLCIRHIRRSHDKVSRRMQP